MPLFVREVAYQLLYHVFLGFLRFRYSSQYSYPECNRRRPNAPFFYNRPSLQRGAVSIPTPPLVALFGLKPRFRFPCPTYGTVFWLSPRSNPSATSCLYPEGKACFETPRFSLAGGVMGWRFRKLHLPSQLLPGEGVHACSTLSRPPTHPLPFLNRPIRVWSIQFHSIPICSKPPLHPNSDYATPSLSACRGTKRAPASA